MNYLSIIIGLGWIMLGVIECFLQSLNTKLLQRNHKTGCFIISFINIMIWFFVLSTIIENINAVGLIILYGLGYASGDVLAIVFDKYLVKIARMKKGKFIRKLFKRRKKK